MLNLDRKIELIGNYLNIYDNIFTEYISQRTKTIFRLKDLELGMLKIDLELESMSKDNLTG